MPPHFLLFGLHIEVIILVGRNLKRHIFNYLQSIRFQSDPFSGIVGHQSHIPHFKAAQYLGSHSVIPLIGLVAEMKVGIYCVKSLFLQFVCSCFAISPIPRPSWFRYTSTPLPSFQSSPTLYAAVPRTRSALNQKCRPLYTMSAHVPV